MTMLAVLLVVAALSAQAVRGYTCPNFCSGRGMCGKQGVCLCPAGWGGADCSLAKCPMGAAWSDAVTGTDVGHNLAECSNRGLCDSDTGECACQPGFTGAACERMTCNCNGHGRCVSMRRYALTKDPGLGVVYPYSKVWDSHKIFGCVCDTGYSGALCTDRMCPTGDDPLTGTVQDPAGIQRNEKQVVTCKATSGSFTLTFRGYTTAPIASSDAAATIKSKLMALPSVRAATVTYGGITLVACTAIGNDISVEFTQNFGNLPAMSVDGRSLVHSTPNTSSSLTLTTAVNGSKEDLPCSRRGYCDRTTGICACYPSFFSSNGVGQIGQRGDCGFVKGTVTACPGEIACSGQGTCRGPPTYDCICNEGFTGGDCNERECPRGKAWFDLPIDDNTAHQLAECSNAGTCDRAKGDCVCIQGFTGAACNRAVCPNDCSGHGTCSTMEDLAKLATLNGERQGWTYGAVPNRKDTWDYDMLRGCRCSAGWQGFDCSLRVCPTGDDPMTRYLSDGVTIQANEVQELFCQGSSGFFILKFRDAATRQLAFSTTSSVLEAALNSLPTISGVRVSFSTNTVAVTSNPACTAAGTTVIRIEFLNDFGDLPPIRWVLDGALTMTINVDGAGGSVRGSKENAECAGRGLCNYKSGVCKCAFGFTSSDGNGNEGSRGDCGYKEPIYINSAGKVANDA